MSLSLKGVTRNFDISLYFFATAFARNKTQLWPNLANRAFILSTHKLSVPSIRMHCSCMYVCVYVDISVFELFRLPIRFKEHCAYCFMHEHVFEYIYTLLYLYVHIYIHTCICAKVVRQLVTRMGSHLSVLVCLCLPVYFTITSCHALFFVWRLPVQSCVLFLFFHTFHNMNCVCTFI